MAKNTEPFTSYITPPLVIPAAAVTYIVLRILYLNW